MINVHAKRCGHPGGCTVHPNFGLPGSLATRCNAHKEPGMVNVRAKLCNYPGGCSKQPAYGLPGGSSAHCTSHKEPGMINVHAKLCDHPGGCTTQPCFGPPYGKAARCYAHKEPGMVNMKHPSRSQGSTLSSPADTSSAPGQQEPATPAATAGGTHDGGTCGGGTGIRVAVGYLGGSAGGVMSVSVAATAGGGGTPPLESGGPTALSKHNPASQPGLVIPTALQPPSVAAPSSYAVVPSSAAATRGHSRRPRQESPVADETEEAVDGACHSSKKPRGAEPSPPSEVTVRERTRPFASDPTARGSSHPSASVCNASHSRRGPAGLSASISTSDSSRRRRPTQQASICGNAADPFGFTIPGCGGGNPPSRTCPSIGSSGALPSRTPSGCSTAGNQQQQREGHKFRSEGGTGGFGGGCILPCCYQGRGALRDSSVVVPSLQHCRYSSGCTGPL